MDCQFSKMGRRKRKMSNTSPEHQLDPTSKQKVQNIFEKKFTYKPNCDWKLTSELHNMIDKWNIDDLMKLKLDLNSLKDRLSDKDIVRWHKHTTYMNIAGDVINELRQYIRPELCTQAWCKFYEIVTTFDLVNLKGYAGEWKWLGSTLNPYYEGNSPNEMIDDDRFVSGSYGNWDFGVDNTGNLMSWPNVEQLRRKAAEMGPVHLVTADGSIDCQDKPAEQEGVVSKLHYCEALSSVLILSPGGNLVLKKFTMFECDTICLMYLLNCLFKKVNVFKPATSKSGNSEVYWVCLDFIGLEDNVQQFEHLCQLYCNYSNSSNQTGCLFAKNEIPISFLEQHVQCCRDFTLRQEETIQRNLDLYDNLSEDNRELIDAMRDFCTELFMSKYNVRSIPGYTKITQVQRVQKRPSSNHKYKEAKRNEGTYNDRVKTHALPWEQKVLHYKMYDVDHSLVQWFETVNPLREEDVVYLPCATGMPIGCIKSSRFCEEYYVHQVQEVLANWKKNPHVTDKLEMSSVISALEILFDLSIYDFPCHVNILSSKETDMKEIEQLEFVNKVTCINDFSTIEDSTNLILVLPDIYQGRDEADVMTKRNLVESLVNMLKVLPKNVIVVLQISTALTRFTAGLVYILTTCFEKVGFLPQPGRESLQQTLICYKYTGLPHFLLEHCCHLLERTNNSSSDNVILESVPVLTLANDYAFVDFLTSSNETLIKSFITSVVTQLRQNLPNQT